MNLKPSCTWRGKFLWPRKTKPKFGLFGSLFGAPKIGVLKTLKASARNCARYRSVMKKLLLIDISYSGRQVTRICAERSDVVRSVFGPRIAQTGLLHASNPVRVAFGWRAVPSSCLTQPLNHLSNDWLSIFGLPIKSTLPGRSIGAPDIKRAIQLYSQPPINRFHPRPTSPPMALPLPNGS